MKSKRPLQGRVALVTGGGRGIGRATAWRLALLGASVAVLASTWAEIEHVAEEISGSGGQALAIRADVADRGQMISAVHSVAEEAGPVDILVNNAGVMALGPVATSDPQTWRYAIEVNLIGAYECLRAVLPGMLERGWGRIVNAFSVVAGMPQISHRSAYVVSKAGLDRLTLAVAKPILLRKLPG